MAASKFYDCQERYGKVNKHNGWIPRDFWLKDWEKQAIIGFHLKNPQEGYRRLTFMMLDADIVAVSRSSVWRVLSHAGLLSKWNGKPSKKGTGFDQPLAAHQHWHIDVSYLNISGTFYYLCSILDGYSRYIVPGTPLSLEDARRLVEGYVDHYNNVRLNSAPATSRRRTWSRAGSRRSTPNGTASWKLPDNNGRVAASMRREERKGPVCANPTGGNRPGARWPYLTRNLNFRISDDTDGILGQAFCGAPRLHPFATRE